MGRLRSHPGPTGRSRPRAACGIVAAAVLVVLVGCGGGSGAGTTGADGETGGTGTRSTAAADGSGTAPAKAAFIKELDAVCEAIPNEYEKKRQALLRGPEKSNATPTRINAVAAVPPIFTAVEAMEELTPPRGDEAEVEAMVDALEAAGKSLEKEPGLRLSGPESPYAEFVALTAKYGTKFCNRL